MQQIMIYELRIRRCVPGRLAALLSRFHNDTLHIWEKHGICQAGFWTTLIGENNEQLILRILFAERIGYVTTDANCPPL